MHTHRMGDAHPRWLAALPQVIQFLTNILSRRYEFQADAFAVRMGKAADLKAGLLKLVRRTNPRTLQLKFKLFGLPCMPPSLLQLALSGPENRI